MEQATTPGLDRLHDRPKLADEVVDALRQSILSGRFAAGEHLVLDAIAADLGVSAMPVREALIALSHEGLVQSMPRRGFRAAPPTPEDLGDIFDVHAHLAGILTGRAAEAATAEDVARIEAVHAAIVTAASGGTGGAVARTLFDLNHQFHHLIHHAGRGDYLRRFLRSTTRLMRRDQFAIDPTWIEATLRDHPPIIEAIRAHDAARARVLAERHFRLEAAPG